MTGESLFEVSGDAYDRLIGRYSGTLAGRLADAAEIASGQKALDIGCGPGALTAELVGRLGAGSVAAIDPSEAFVDECRRRNPGVDVRSGSAELLPYDDGAFDAVLSQLVLHFVAAPETAAAEMRRVLRPGGVVAGCVWDFTGGMTLLRTFWKAALAIDPAAPAESATRRFGADGEVADLFRAAGFKDVVAGAIEVAASYADLDDLWSGFTNGVGPVGAYNASLEPEHRAAIRAEIGRRLGNPIGPFVLSARAWYATGRS